nr:hypothetical protein Iba_chr11eCG10210 [Ipomoea batatas]
MAEGDNNVDGILHFSDGQQRRSPPFSLFGEQSSVSDSAVVSATQGGSLTRSRWWTTEDASRLAGDGNDKSPAAATTPPASSHVASLSTDLLAQEMCDHTGETLPPSSLSTAACGVNRCSFPASGVALLF